MKKKLAIAFFMILGLLLFPPKSRADMPVVDFVNAALNEFRNSLMQSQFAQDIKIAMERLQQLKATYLELTRFNSGLDDFFKVAIGDPVKQIFSQGESRARDVFNDLGWFTPQIQMIETGGPQDIRYALEKMTGPLPENSEARPYIPFEEMQVIDGMQFAQEIRSSGESTRDAAQQLSNQATTASPKGAARLSVEAQAQMINLSQQNQEALAKLIELEATQVEQTSRDEKRIERARQSYMEDFRTSLQNLWGDSE